MRISGRENPRNSVKSESTFPPRETFNKDASTIARTMASKRVSHPDDPVLHQPGRQKSESDPGWVTTSDGEIVGFVPRSDVDHTSARRR
jgi:hypothetical protein